MTKNSNTHDVGDVASDFASEKMRLPKVLVVDDVEENLFAMQRTLARLACEVITARSGADALALTLRHEFSVILLDVQMPVMNGFETARFLRENPDTRNVPIIFVTAISKEQRHVAAGYGSGAVDYMFKPVEADILLSKVGVFMELDIQRRKLKRMVDVISEVSHKQQVLLESTVECIVGVDADGVISFANPAAQDAIGGSAALTGRPLMHFFADGDPHHGTTWKHSAFMDAMVNQERMRGVEGRLKNETAVGFSAEYSFSPFSPNYGISGGVLVFQDVTTRRQVQDALYKMARYDELTGLPNRTLFRDTLDRALAKGKREKKCVGVLFLDLDGFKQVNDTMGHGCGDQVLREFAGRLKDSLRASDFAGRLSGDEFVVLVDDAVSGEELATLAAKICTLCDAPFVMAGQSLVLSVSVGLACEPEGGSTVDGLLSAADSAMYRAKGRGKGKFSA